MNSISRADTAVQAFRVYLVNPVNPAKDLFFRAVGEIL
jgi:hypothetical protein